MGKSIVAADDSPTIRNLLRAWLTQAGYELRLCCNGQEALSVVQQEPPDLVLTDLDMPVMDGLTLCRSLKAAEATAHIPVVMFTRMNDPHDILRGLDAGADAFVVKGSDKVPLLARVSHSLEEGRTGRSRGVAKDIGNQLGLTSGRKNLFKVLFESLCREVPIDVLAILVRAVTGKPTSILVSRRPLPASLVSELELDLEKAMRPLLDPSTDQTPVPVAREQIVLDEGAAPHEAGSLTGSAARVPLVADGAVFGAFAVFAFQAVPAFADNIRFFFDVGAESAKALRRFSIGE